MKLMEVQPHHKTPDNIIEMFMMLGALLMAGIGKAIGEIHTLIIPTAFWHTALMASQGLMYLTSSGVGTIAIYRFFKKPKNKSDKQE